MIQWLDAFATHGVGDRARKKGGSIFREGSCHEIFGVGGRDGLVGWAHRSRGLLVYPHAAPGIFGVLFFMTFNCRIMMFKCNERTITMQIGSGELFCFRSGPDKGRLRLSVFSGTHIGVWSEWGSVLPECSRPPRNLLLRPARCSDDRSTQFKFSYQCLGQLSYVFRHLPSFFVVRSTRLFLVAGFLPPQWVFTPELT